MHTKLGVLSLWLVLGGIAGTALAKDKWFEARSQHFTLVSNGSEGRAKDVLADLEQLRRLITNIFPAQPVDGAKPTLIYAFKNEKSMRPFQPLLATGENTKREDWAAIYRPTAFRNIVLLRANGRREAARKLAFGQYMHLLESYGNARYPVWLSNGLSRFYGNTEILDKTANIGKTREGYRRVLGEFRYLPIRELFAVDHASEHYRDLDKRPLFDAQSWALVHYLLIGRLDSNGPRRLGEYLQMLREGREPLLAFQEAMGMTLDTIDARVSTYIRKSIASYIKVELSEFEVDEDEFEITKLDEIDTEAHIGQLFMATRHYEEAYKSLSSSIEARPDQIVAYEAIASLRERQGNSDEVRGFLERAVRNGSTNPLIHLRKAQLFINERGGDNAMMNSDVTTPVLESLRLVIRDAPELWDAARLFAFLALHQPDVREEAHQIVADALKREPGTPSLVFMLGQLHARDGSYGAARAVLRRLLDQKLDPSFRASVQRQYDWVDTRLRQEARRADALRAAASVAESEPGAETPSAAPSSDPKPASAADRMSPSPFRDTIRNNETIEVRGTLVKFDCTDGHRFVVNAEGRLHLLKIEDLARVRVLEKGENVGTREFYCGPMDEAVTVRFVPTPAKDDEVTRHGRLVVIDFLGSSNENEF